MDDDGIISGRISLTDEVSGGIGKYDDVCATLFSLAYHQDSIIHSFIHPTGHLERRY
jgi:hypothetical protein